MILGTQKFFSLGALLGVAWFCSASVFAYETDQLRGRNLVVTDVQGQVDGYVNEALERARVRAQERLRENLWESETSLTGIQAQEILRDEIIEEFPFLKSYFGTPMEKWMTEVLMPKGYAVEPGGVGTGLRVNIYDRAPSTYLMNPFVDPPTPAMVLSFARLVAGTSLAPTFMTNTVRYGADKWSHFFRLGYRYWKRSSGGEDPASGIRYGTGTEKGGVGYLTSGALSFADLAANYDGYRFFRDLFDDQNGHFEVVPFRFWQKNKRGLSRGEWRRGWDIQWKRSFRSVDFVADDWDEVLNPNIYRPHFKRAIQLHLKENKETVCAEYEQWREEAVERKSRLRPLVEYVDLAEVREQVDPFRLDVLCF